MSWTSGGICVGRCGQMEVGVSFDTSVFRQLPFLSVESPWEIVDVPWLYETMWLQNMMLVYDSGVFPSDLIVFFNSVFRQGVGINVHSSSMFFNPLREISACLSNTRLATVSARNSVYNITPGFLWNRVFRMRQDVPKRSKGLENCLNIKFSQHNCPVSVCLVYDASGSNEKGIHSLWKAVTTCLSSEDMCTRGQSGCPCEQGPDDSLFMGNRMVRRELEVLICVVLLPVDRCWDSPIILLHQVYVQEREFVVLLNLLG